MKTHAEYDAQLSSQRLSDLQDMTAELERRLSDARLTLERELAGGARKANGGGRVHIPDERTQTLLNNGRASAYRPGAWRRMKIAAGAAMTWRVDYGLLPHSLMDSNEDESLACLATSVLSRVHDLGGIQIAAPLQAPRKVLKLRRVRKERNILHNNRERS